MRLYNFIIAVLFFSGAVYSQEKTINTLKFEGLIKEGDSLAEAGKIKESIIAYTEAVKIEKASQAYKRRGMSYFADDNFKEAVADFTEVIKLEKNDAEMYFMRGLCKMQLKEPEVNYCDDLKSAKNLKYEIDWELFRHVCPDME